MLKTIFTNLLLNYTNNGLLIENLWIDIEKRYSNKNRFYHNLQHIENVYHQLQDVKKHINQWDVLLFSLFYHDVIYNPLQSDNEAKSAEFARKIMLEIGVPAQQIKLCIMQIESTKSHQISIDYDTNYFTDADLSILGETWDNYETYFKAVRKEYAIYPNFMYNGGRKKVLQHFLAMPRIFKTQHYFETLEQQAKQNIQKEILLLS